MKKVSVGDELTYKSVGRDPYLKGMKTKIETERLIWYERRRGPMHWSRQERRDENRIRSKIESIKVPEKTSSLSRSRSLALTRHIRTTQPGPDLSL